MIRAITLALAALTLGGCATVHSNFQPPVLITVDPALTAKNACPSWPRKGDVIVTGSEQEASDYDLAGYKAYRCERSTRLKIGTQMDKLTADAAARAKAK